MPDRLPPLTALRAFDAAARHLSFRGAAGELNVTPSALSFQIKQLEEHLGTPLFRRLNRQVELTEAGAALAPAAAEGFATLMAGWRTARRTLDGGLLTVTAGPAFTARWLAPRLFDFASRHPEVALRFAATLRLLDFARDEVDVAIRFGIPPASEAELHLAMTIGEWMTPMAAPEVAARLRTPSDLLRETLIHQDDIAWLHPPIDWPAWLRAAGVEADGVAGPRFSQADHALDAAQAGAGVVLGRAVLADQALRSGALVAPFDLSLVPDATFRVLCPKGAQTRPATRAFLGWLAEAVEGLAERSADRRFVAVGDVAPPA